MSHQHSSIGAGVPRANTGEVLRSGNNLETDFITRHIEDNYRVSNKSQLKFLIIFLFMSGTRTESSHGFLAPLHLINKTAKRDLIAHVFLI